VTLASLLDDGYRVDRVASTPTSVTVDLVRADGRACVTLGVPGARAVLEEGVPGRAREPGPDAGERARRALATLAGLIADGFQLVRVDSGPDGLALELRCGRAAETLALAPAAARRLARGLLGDPDAAAEGAVEGPGGRSPARA